MSDPSSLPDAIRIAPFRPQDQQAARQLILRGLAEHFGWVDEDRNPDLDDIARTFADGHFVVARLEGAIVGTGGFLPVSEDTVQIHRVSVSTDRRRHGIGSAIFGSLLGAARDRGVARVILETTETWSEVIAFWQHNGFRPFDHRDGDIYLRLQL